MEAKGLQKSYNTVHFAKIKMPFITSFIVAAGKYNANFSDLSLFQSQVTLSDLPFSFLFGHKRAGYILSSFFRVVAGGFLKRCIIFHTVPRKFRNIKLL